MQKRLRLKGQPFCRARPFGLLDFIRFTLMWIDAVLSAHKYPLGMNYG